MFCLFWRLLLLLFAVYILFVISLLFICILYFIYVDSVFVVSLFICCGWLWSSCGCPIYMHLMVLPKFCCNVVWGLQYLIRGKREFWFCILCCHCFLWGIGGWGGLSTSANCSMKSVSRSLSTSYKTFKNLTKVYFLYTFLGFFLKSGKKIALGSYLGA